MIRNIVLAFLFFSVKVSAFHFDFKKIGPHRFYIGPEVCFFKRKIETGAFQDGMVYGARFQYDRICQNAFYWGVDGVVSKGTLRGRTSSGISTKSKLTEKEIEARAGYTLGVKKFSFTLFLGGGFLRSINQFQPPTPLTLRFDNKIDFTCFGFLFKAALAPCLEMGFHFKERYMIEGKVFVGNDPIEGDQVQIIENKPFYYLEFPIRYHNQKKVEFTCIPFFYFRHYGRRENFPRDFKDTKISIYGIRGLFVYRF